MEGIGTGQTPPNPPPPPKKYKKWRPDRDGKGKNIRNHPVTK